jgi:hypothetical protein
MAQAVDMLVQTHPIPPLKMEEVSTSETQAKLSTYTLFKTQEENQYQRRIALKAQHQQEPNHILTTILNVFSYLYGKSKDNVFALFN